MKKQKLPVVYIGSTIIQTGDAISLTVGQDDESNALALDHCCVILRLQDI